MAVTYFVDDIIGAKTLGDDGRPTRIVGRNVGFCALVWIIIYFCVAFGIKWTGRYVKNEQASIFFVICSHLSSETIVASPTSPWVSRFSFSSSSLERQ